MWATIEEFPEYAISSFGRVKSLKFDRMLTPRSNGYGYQKVVLRRDGRSYEKLVHRLVAQAFVSGFREHTKVTHAEDNTNNHVNNLRLLKGARMGRLVQEHDPVRPRRLKIIETGQVFRTAEDAARYLGGDKSSIYAVLRGDRRSHRGYTFEHFYG